MLIVEGNYASFHWPSHSYTRTNPRRIKAVATSIKLDTNVTAEDGNTIQIASTFTSPGTNLALKSKKMKRIFKK